MIITNHVQERVKNNVCFNTYHRLSRVSKPNKTMCGPNKVPLFGQ